jgi:hypothetical protein
MPALAGGVTIGIEETPIPLEGSTWNELIAEAVGKDGSVAAAAIKEPLANAAPFKGDGV